MDSITIKEAAAALGSGCDLDGEIQSVVIDSREIAYGCLFIAIAGERFDGHNFVAQAFASGAVAAVCSYIPQGADSSRIILVEDTRKAFLQLAEYYRSKFCIPVIGLTGSVGKTTTKEMAAAVLSAKYKTVFTQGNLNNEIGLPRMCFQIDSTTQAAVLEMGMNHSGEISRLTRTARPTVGLINNIGVSHIENLGSQEGILRAKMEILEGMGKTAPLVLNADDPLLFAAAEGIQNPVVFFGIDNRRADFRAENIVQKDSEMHFDIRYAGLVQKIVIPAIGRHNVLNACAAFCVGAQLDIPAEDMAGALRAYNPSGMRQRIVKKGGITVIEDCYNASPDSVRASLSAFSSMNVHGKRVVVLGDMLELGSYSRKAHAECGRFAAENGADVLFTYGSNAQYYIDGALEKGLNGTIFQSKAELADALLQCLREGDAVLFKASRGMRLEEVITELYERWNKV